MIAVLRQVDRKRLIPIDRAVILVGRSAECDVVITTSQKISRQHCCLVQSDQSYFVRDLGSMNGVWLNGQKVNREAEMKAGDRLCIGDVEFKLFTNVKVESKKQLRTDGVTEEDLASQAVRTNSIESGDESSEEEFSGEHVIDDPEEFEILDDVIPLNPAVPMGSKTNELKASDEFVIDEKSAQKKKPKAKEHK
ncbi:MAG: FHA domain-containing protein [Fuerstiella sp.]